VFAAIDKHGIPRYDKESKDELKRGQSKKGTTKFETYITTGRQPKIQAGTRRNSCVTRWFQR